MDIVNNSHGLVTVAVFKTLPYSAENRVALTGEIGGGGGKASVSVPAGDYYVDISYGSVGRPLPAGTNIARSGGVPSGGTVTLTLSDRIVIT